MDGFALIMAGGKEGAIAAVSEATAGTVLAIANVANNSHMLAVASQGLLGSGNDFSTAIGLILQNSKKYSDILFNNGGDMDALLAEIQKDTENVAKQNSDGISEGNKNLMEATKGLEQAAVKLEQLVLQNLGGALMAQVYVINKSIGMINKMLNLFTGNGNDNGTNYSAEKATFITQGVESFENAKTIAEAQSSSSSMGYHSGFRDGNFEPLGGDLLNNFSGPNMTLDDARKMYDEKMNNNNNNVTSGAPQVNNNNVNDDGTVKATKTNPMAVDMAEMRDILKQQLRLQKQQIDATNNISGSGTY